MDYFSSQRLAFVALVVLSLSGVFAGFAIAQPAFRPELVPIDPVASRPETGPAPEVAAARIVPDPEVAAARIVPAPVTAEVADPVATATPWSDPLPVELAAIAQHVSSELVSTTEVAPEHTHEHTHDPVSSGDPWAGVRRCESGGDYSINTGNGFYGAYQFTLSTWDWVAGIVGRSDLIGIRPDLGAPSDQDRLAQALAFEIAGGGLGHWPVCGAYYG